MFPYKDDNPTLRTPVVTIAIILANVAVWVFVQGAGNEAWVVASLCRLGFIPGEFLGAVAPGTTIPLGPGVSCELGGSPTWITPFSSMFMHGGWMHLIGNMWFLWIFGNNVEDTIGHARFGLFYLASGVVAAVGQTLITPTSAVPMIGASGAVSGVLGAYLLLFPHATILTLVMFGFFVKFFRVPALIVLGFWILLQLLNGYLSYSAQAPGRGESGGVAWFAHIGGFLGGIALLFLLRPRRSRRL